MNKEKQLKNPSNNRRDKFIFCPLDGLNGKYSLVCSCSDEFMCYPSDVAPIPNIVSCSYFRKYLEFKGLPHYFNS